MAEVWEANLETFAELTDNAMALDSQERVELISQPGLYLRGARSESFTVNEIKKVVEDRNVGDEFVEKIKKEWLWITEPGTVGDAYNQGFNERHIEGRQVKSFEIAAKMIAAGMTTQKISDFTGLSIVQIDALRQIQGIIRRFFLSDSIFFNLARQKFGLSTENNDAL